MYHSFYHLIWIQTARLNFVFLTYLSSVEKYFGSQYWSPNLSFFSEDSGVPSLPVDPVHLDRCHDRVSGHWRPNVRTLTLQSTTNDLAFQPSTSQHQLSTFLARRSAHCKTGPNTWYCHFLSDHGRGFWCKEWWPGCKPISVGSVWSCFWQWLVPVYSMILDPVFDRWYRG